MLVIIVLSIFSLSLMHLSIASLKEAIGKCIQRITASNAGRFF